MKSNLKMFVGIATLAVMGTTHAHAWTGPICYMDKDQTITLTLETYAGEKPGDLLVGFKDNDGELDLVSVRPSSKRPDSHEVLLRHKVGNSGIVGVHLYTPLAQGGHGPTYEFEFRKGMECNGAIIESELTEGSPLSDALAEFNESLQESKPWGAHLVTESDVKQSIKDQLETISLEYRDEYRLIMAGRMPATARFVYHASEGRYFFVRLEVSHGPMGYSLQIGNDVR